MSKNTPPLRAAIYARQSVKEDEGVAQQVKHCRTIAEEIHGWEVVGEYCDNATSASKSRASGTRWADMLADFDAGLFDVVVCVSVDRLLRRVVDVVQLRKGDAEGQGRTRDVRIVTARDGIDTGGTLGRTVLTILVALAEGEIESKKARMLPYAERRREEGHPWPGRVPFGYRWIPEVLRVPDKNGPRWRIDPDEAEIVRRIFAAFLSGPKVKLGGIARDLNSQGFRTRARREGEPGGLWTTTSLRRILLSPFYAALLPPVQGWADFDAARVVIEDCVPGAWDEIIPVERVLAARARLLVADRRKHDGNARRWLLSGLGRCDVCGVAIRSARTRKGVHGYRCPVGHFLRGGDILDAYVEHVVIQRLSADDALDLLTPPKSGPDLAVLMAQRSALEGRDSAIASMVADGSMRPEAAREALAVLSAELQSVNAAIAQAIDVDPLADLVTADDVGAAWSQLSLERQRAVIDALCVPVVRPIGKGRTATTLDEAEPTVAIVWRKPSRSSVALPTLVNEAASLDDLARISVPSLDTDARAAISTALN